jgi:hypothetical protein
MISADDFESLKAETLHDVAADWTGVWEVWWRANALFPSEPMSERIAVAERVIQELTDEGLVAIYQAGPWPDRVLDSTPIADVGATLGKWEAWVPSGESTFWLVRES